MQLIAQRRIFDDFFRIDEAEILVGHQKQRRLSLERGDSVAAVVERVDDGAILLTRQFRYPTLAKGPGFMIELPAGIVEEGEVPEDSLRREVVEELGYQIEQLQPLASFYASPGTCSERIHVYHATVSRSGQVGPGGGLADEGEDIEILEVTPDELASMVRSGAVVDAKTIVGALWLAQRDQLR